MFAVRRYESFLSSRSCRLEILLALPGCSNLCVTLRVPAFFCFQRVASNLALHGVSTWVGEKWREKRQYRTDSSECPGRVWRSRRDFIPLRQVAERSQGHSPGVVRRGGLRLYEGKSDGGLYVLYSVVKERSTLGQRERTRTFLVASQAGRLRHAGRLAVRSKLVQATGGLYFFWLPCANRGAVKTKKPSLTNRA